MVERPKLETRNLSITYPDGTESLRNISLAIQPHLITVLFGPAGGGKSTLLRTFNRLNDLAEGTRRSGEVLVDGEDIYAPNVDVNGLRRRIGMVFAMPVTLPMSIRQNIAYGLRLAGMRGKAIDEAVERSLRQSALWDEVKDRLDDPAISLSGGQQQRLCLARTLALEPEVILLDEPTSGLDPISTAQVEASLQELKKRYTIVFVPQSIQQAARVADRAAFILQGELIEYGPPEQIFTNPKDERTERYVTGRFG